MGSILFTYPIPDDSSACAAAVADLVLQGMELYVPSLVTVQLSL